MSELRRGFRRALSNEAPAVGNDLAELVDAVRAIDAAILGMIDRRFPVFLVPAPGETLEGLRAVETVQIGWDEEAWFLRHPERDGRWLTFDLPRAVLEHYVDQDGVLSRRSALELKGEYLAEIHGYYGVDDRPSLVTFRLDGNWLEGLRRGAGRHREGG